MDLLYFADTLSGLSRGQCHRGQHPQDAKKDRNYKAVVQLQLQGEKRTEETFLKSETGRCPQK